MTFESNIKQRRCQHVNNLKTLQTQNNFHEFLKKFAVFSIVFNDLHRGFKAVSTVINALIT